MSTPAKEQVTALIVDDEADSREVIAAYLSRYCPQVVVVGEAGGVKEAETLIRKHKPQLLFLDVEMPYGNGFDLLEQVGEMDFEVIFVTAYSHYAIKALNMSAAYYLLKPIEIDALVEAVEKVAETIASKDQDSGWQTRILVENMHAISQQHHKVVLPLMDGFEVVQVGDIIRCEANDNFTNFHLNDGSTRMICRTLKFYEGVLEEFGFLRVHKSHLVNLQYIKRYKKGKGGQLILSDDSVVDVAPGKKQSLLDKF